ncbi:MULTISPECIES: hypothetical protein [Alteribacillus]|uniref:Uncharacterized protein n=1 Tax=Alteribacillus bidgolensis TaxID=930129 RepID=A0A1G8ESE4_9BACI|nr:MULTISPECIES: hypothetical protein [Alteribacillus]SDH72764.1 hypothetical protein SAMN05216352_102358 [Alteribacillus bidgolensis]
MEQIQLEVLLEFMYPQGLALLKKEERNVPIVLQDGLRDVSETDVQEIVEAVIMERGKSSVPH